MVVSVTLPSSFTKRTSKGPPGSPISASNGGLVRRGGVVRGMNQSPPYGVSGGPHRTRVSGLSCVSNIHHGWSSGGRCRRPRPPGAPWRGPEQKTALLSRMAWPRASNVLLVRPADESDQDAVNPQERGRGWGLGGCDQDDWERTNPKKGKQTLRDCVQAASSLRRLSDSRISKVFTVHSKKSADLPNLTICSSRNLISKWG